MIKNEFFSKKTALYIFFIELILTVIFSFFTLYFIDFVSIVNSIMTKFTTENNTVDSLRYFTEWFVIGFGGMVGTAVIYYKFIDGIIITYMVFIKCISRMLNKFNIISTNNEEKAKVDKSQ